MKKLLFIIGLLIACPAYGNVITVQTFSGDSSVTHLENFRSVVVTFANGNIAGGSGGTSNANAPGATGGSGAGGLIIAQIFFQ